MLLGLFKFLIVFYIFEEHPQSLIEILSTRSLLGLSSFFLCFVPLHLVDQDVKMAHRSANFYKIHAVHLPPQFVQSQFHLFNVQKKVTIVPFETTKT